MGRTLFFFGGYSGIGLGHHSARPGSHHVFYVGNVQPGEREKLNPIHVIREMAGCGWDEDRPAKA